MPDHTFPPFEFFVDGLTDDDTFQGDGHLPPFRIFMPQLQSYLPGTFPTRAAAATAVEKITLALGLPASRAARISAVIETLSGLRAGLAEEYGPPAYLGFAPDAGQSDNGVQVLSFTRKPDSVSITMQAADIPDNGIGVGGSEYAFLDVDLTTSQATTLRDWLLRQYPVSG